VEDKGYFKVILINCRICFWNSFRGVVTHYLRCLITKGNQNDRSPSYVTVAAIVSHPVSVVHCHFPDNSERGPLERRGRDEKKSENPGVICNHAWTADTED